MSKVSSKMLQGIALVLARRIYAGTQECNREMVALRDEYSARMKALQEEHEEASKELWKKLQEEVGFDLSKPYRVDATYLEDHGLAFLVEESAPMEVDPSGRVVHPGSNTEQ